LETTENQNKKTPLEANILLSN